MEALRTLEIPLIELVCRECKSSDTEGNSEAYTPYMLFNIPIESPDDGDIVTVSLDVQNIRWLKRKHGYSVAHAVMSVHCPRCENPHSLRYQLAAPIILLNHIGVCKTCNGQLSVEEEEIEYNHSDDTPPTITIRGNMVCKNCAITEEAELQLQSLEMQSLLQANKLELEMTDRDIRIKNPDILTDRQAKKEILRMLTPEQQAAWLVLQKAFSLVANELKQRWQLAREKVKSAESSQQTKPSISEPLQSALKSKLETVQDTAQLRMVTDDLETAIKMAERFNRRRNKYRQQLPSAVDTVPIEMQVEEAETERDKAITEIKAIFEKLAQEEVLISTETD